MLQRYLLKLCDCCCLIVDPQKLLLKMVLIFSCLICALYCSDDSLNNITIELQKANIYWRDDFYCVPSSKYDNIAFVTAGTTCLLWQANVIDAAIEATKKNKNGWLAALLSLLIPGAGQLYNGQRLKSLGTCCLTYGFGIITMAERQEPPFRFEYFPIKQEEKLFNQAKKFIYPLEVKRHPANFLDSLVCWFGVIKSFEIDFEGDTVDLIFVIEHKYYDYKIIKGVHIEDLFLSPLGEGDFVFNNMRFETSDTLKIKDIISNIAKPGNLAICYGYPYISVDSNIPVLRGECIIMADEIWFTTEVLSYTITRDKYGKPVIENIVCIKNLKRGKND